MKQSGHICRTLLSRLLGFQELYDPVATFQGLLLASEPSKTYKVEGSFTANVDVFLFACTTAGCCAISSVAVCS